MITPDQFYDFVKHDIYKWAYALDNKVIMPVEWRTLIYKHKGTAEEEVRCAEYFKFSRACYDIWLGLNAQDKTRPVLKVVKTAEYLTVCYTVWQGRVYLPSEKVDYRNLPQLNNCNIVTAIKDGLINQVADNEQFKVVDMIWTTKQLHGNKTQ